MRTIDFAPIENLVMTNGVGDASITACVVAQAAIIEQLQQGKAIKATDYLDCACPLLRTFAIALNDISWWDSDAERTAVLRPLIPALLDSRVGPLAMSQRARLASDFSAIAAKYAAESAAESAESAAKYAAKSAAEYAAKYAEHAAEMRMLRGELLKCFWDCESIKDEVA